MSRFTTTTTLRIRSNIFLTKGPSHRFCQALPFYLYRFHSTSTLFDSSSPPQLQIRSHLGSLNPAHVPCSTLDSLYNSINAYAPIPNRGLLQIQGRDSSKLLQGLITNHMVKLRQEPGFYSAFLSPQVTFHLQFHSFQIPFYKYYDDLNFPSIIPLSAPLFIWFNG